MKIRAADAKEVGVGNPAEETCCYPNEAMLQPRAVLSRCRWNWQCPHLNFPERGSASRSTVDYRKVLVLVLPIRLAATFAAPMERRRFVGLTRKTIRDVQNEIDDEPAS